MGEEVMGPIKEDPQASNQRNKKNIERDSTEWLILILQRNARRINNNMYLQTIYKNLVRVYDFVSNNLLRHRLGRFQLKAQRSGRIVSVSLVQ